MSRFRLYPTPEQEAVLLRYCADARFVWNLGNEQRLMYRPGRGSTPGYAEQCLQLTEARAAEPWLAAGCAMVQQQALRDLDQAWKNFFAGIHNRPGWRKAGVKDGFRVVGRRGQGMGTGWDARRLSRKVGEVKVPKLGWVRFRWSRPIPDDAKSYHVTMDRAHRWHVAFASIPDPIPAPGNGEVVGIDRGVTVSAALSTGEMLTVPRLNPQQQARFLRLERKLSKAKPGSQRRGKAKLALARLKARERDMRKDWAEKTSTGIVRRFDVIRVEDLNIRDMMRRPKSQPVGGGAWAQNGSARKTGLNREIAKSGWGLLVRRLEDKAPGRVERINPRFTSQRCSACGHIAAGSRKSQALFACVACNFTLNADVNAARNIAAGHAANARGGDRGAGPANREPRAA